MESEGVGEKRAQAILKDGPDPDFVEPGGLDKAEGFSTAPADGPFPLGTPEDYGHGKSRLFPQEGGPAIVEIEVPESITNLGIQPGGEVWFGPSFGLEELLDAWASLPKRIDIP